MYYEIDNAFEIIIRIRLLLLLIIIRRLLLESVILQIRKRERLAGRDDDTSHKKLDKFSPNCRIATKSRLPIE